MRESRGHMTYVAAVANDPEVHRILPQQLLPNTARMTRADKARLAALPAPLVQVKDTQGWVTAENFCGILTRIRRACRRVHPNRPVIIVMDCAPQHLARNVQAHIRRLGLLVVLVPASMTWLLQPLDTHVFQHLKESISSAQTTCRGEAPDGVMPPGRWVDIVARSIRETVVECDCRNVMKANGVFGPVAEMRPRISETLGAALPMMLSPPTAEEFAILLGRNRPRLLETCLHEARRLQREREIREGWVARGEWPVARRLGPALPRPAGAAASSGDVPAGAVPAEAVPAELRRTRSGALY